MRMGHPKGSPVGQTFLPFFIHDRKGMRSIRLCGGCGNRIGEDDQAQEAEWEESFHDLSCSTPHPYPPQTSEKYGAEDAHRLSAMATTHLLFQAIILPSFAQN